MELSLILTTFLLIFSKFLDCYTTSKKINNINHEQNPLARKIMAKVGVHTTIWLIFLLTIIIVSVSYLTVIKTHTRLLQMTYVALGCFISTIQFAVAHNNYTGRNNPITRSIFHIISKLK